MLNGHDQRHPNNSDLNPGSPTIGAGEPPNPRSGVRGNVVPSTSSNVILVGRTVSGQRLVGKSRVGTANEQIGRVTLPPLDLSIHPDPKPAIEEADLIILGPGSSFTSIVSNLLVPKNRDRDIHRQKSQDLRLQRGPRPRGDRRSCVNYPRERHTVLRRGAGSEHRHRQHQPDSGAQFGPCGAGVSRDRPAGPGCMRGQGCHRRKQANVTWPSWRRQ